MNVINLIQFHNCSHETMKPEKKFEEKRGLNKIQNRKLINAPKLVKRRERSK